MGIPVPWARFALPGVYAPTSTGAPMPGAKLYFYKAGTTDPLDTFTESTLTQPNTNPVEADQNGIWPNIFLQLLPYRVVWTDENDVEIRTWDPVAPFVPTEEAEVETTQLVIVVDGNNQTPRACVATPTSTRHVGSRRFSCRRTSPATSSSTSGHRSSSPTRRPQS